MRERSRLRYDGHSPIYWTIMKPTTITLALCGAALLTGCAGTPTRPTLVLEDYMEGAPRDAACVALDERALARGRSSGFKLVAKEMTVAATPGASTEAAQRQLDSRVPLGSHPVDRMARQLDGTFHSVFVNCQTRLAYIAKRGGVIDSIYWFGPFDL